MGGMTIGRHHAGRRPDFQQDCDYCGVTWLMSELRRDSEGYWVCPDDWGKTAKDLDMANAASASRVTPMRGKIR